MCNTLYVYWFKFLWEIIFFINVIIIIIIELFDKDVNILCYTLDLLYSNSELCNHNE